MSRHRSAPVAGATTGRTMKTSSSFRGADLKALQGPNLGDFFRIFTTKASARRSPLAARPGRAPGRVEATTGAAPMRSGAGFQRFLTVRVDKSASLIRPTAGQCPGPSGQRVDMRPRRSTTSRNRAMGPALQGRAAGADTARWGDRRAAALPVVLTVPPSRLAAELQRCADAGTDLAIRNIAARQGARMRPGSESGCNAAHK